MGWTSEALALAALIAFPFFLHAQTTKVSDPIFGIQYNPAIVHFRKAPPIIGGTCKDMRGKNISAYAHASYHGTQYFIVQEYLGEFGVAIAIRGRHCAEIDSDRFLYNGPDTLKGQGIVVKEDEEKQLMDSIANNILSGYSKAFGGKQKFLQALGTRVRNLPNSELRTEIEKYERSK